MGDEAEYVFETVAPLGRWQRFGHDRTQLYMGKMSSARKHKPDYETAEALVEVVGMGRDGVLKLRTTKWHALRAWNNHIDPCYLFVWNRSVSMWALVSYEATKRLVNQARRGPGVQSFDVDNNTYFPIEWEWIEKIAEQVGEYHAPS